MIDKKLKAVVQGGVDNYLGKQPQVQAPRKWQSAPDKPATELAYITEAEKDLILKANIHGGLEGGPNMGPSGIMSLDSFGDVGGAGASGGDTDAGGGASQGAGTGGGGFSGRNTNTTTEREFDRQKANQRAALQIAERKQARDLGYKERANIANATYGPLQKYTDRSRFFGGANKYGYTDTLPDGSLKPGFGGRFFGGLMSLLTGVPFVGSAIGNMYDKGKGIFGPKQRDMSQFNKLGLGGVKPGTYDFNPDAQINQDVDTTGYSRFSNASLGTPEKFNREFDINEIASLIEASKQPQGMDLAGERRAMTQPGFTDQATVYDPYGINLEDGRFSYDMNKTSVDDFNNPGITGIDVGYPSNDLMAFNSGTILDKKLKNLYSGYENLGIQDPGMIDLMKQDMQQNQEKGTPLSLPKKAYNLVT